MRRPTVDDLAREQRKADADVEQVKARRQRDRERIDAGLVSDPKQLQAMQHEIGRCTSGSATSKTRSSR